MRTPSNCLNCVVELRLAPLCSEDMGDRAVVESAMCAVSRSCVSYAPTTNPLNRIVKEINSNNMYETSLVERTTAVFTCGAHVLYIRLLIN